jgi:carboxyl-terminal processing protease
LKTDIGPRLKAYVIDLRDNRGGPLDIAIGVADSFLDRGVIVITRGRMPKDIERASAHPGDIADGKPLVVLINRGTAAGAEILAAALQDHKRARIVGAHSYGAGTIQTIIPLGSNGTFSLTTRRILRPNGASLAQGVEPDTLLENSIGASNGGADDWQLNEAAKLVRAAK